MWTSVKHQLHKHQETLKGWFTPRQRKQMYAYVEEAQNHRAPASGEIFGLLKQMKETFETNLANSQKEEATSQKDYEDLKAAKEGEIAAGQELVDSKTQELAATDEKCAQAKEDLVSTRESLAADTKFLASLKETCA